MSDRVMEDSAAYSDCDNPGNYGTELDNEQRSALQDWIARNIEPARRENRYQTSYGLKHLFEKSAHGFYLTNGAFKGAMLAADYQPVNLHNQNWTFRIKECAKKPWAEVCPTSLGSPKMQPSERICVRQTTLKQGATEASKLHLGRSQVHTNSNRK